MFLPASRKEVHGTGKVPKAVWFSDKAGGTVTVIQFTFVKKRKLQLGRVSINVKPGDWKVFSG